MYFNLGLWLKIFYILGYMCIIKNNVTIYVYKEKKTLTKLINIPNFIVIFIMKL